MITQSILAFKPGHDGTIAYLKNGKLGYSLEAEKNSFPRYSAITPSVLLEAMEIASDIPDVIALGGWSKGWQAFGPPLEAGYFGYSDKGIQTRKTTLFGKQVDFFSSTHERSHIMGCYGMSPFPQGQPCYMLLWEGSVGSFYEIDRELNVINLGEVMNEPGNKYGFLYSLADPTTSYEFSFTNAGKLMALAGYSDRTEMNADELATTKYIVEKMILGTSRKTELNWSPYFNIGVEAPAFTNFAGKFSDYLFNKFYQYAKRNCNKGYPLLIGGGCGLNCEWNTKWKNSGLFSEVFVPPVTNDTGSAIGTAVDALYYYTKNAKIEWDVYSGPSFKHDDYIHDLSNFKVVDLDLDYLAKLLSEDKIFALVQGNCEIGPRALGNRSLIAAPFRKEVHSKLNSIKGRESYRPIAPICIEEDVSEFFDWVGPSPYMLYFQKVKHPGLKAITHADQTARVQTVSKTSNNSLYQILKAFKRLTGVGVLCNTSLNFNGCGFINNFPDLLQYSSEKALDGFILEDKLYLNQASEVFV